MSDILAATPNLLGLSGNPNALDLTDFDNAPSWGVSASSRGNVLLKHPNGTIELMNVPFSSSTDSIRELAGAGAIVVDTTGTTPPIGGGNGINTIAATPGIDALVGTSGRDAILGLAGNDVINRR